MTQIAKGASLPVPSRALRVAVAWRTGPGVPDVDVSALLLDAGGRVRGDGDLVFRHRQEHPSRAVRHLGKSAPGAPGATAADWLSLDLARVESGIERVVVVASCACGVLGQVPALDVRVTDTAGAPAAYFALGDATAETASVLGEFHRRDGGWAFRAVGQGYASGLAGLVTEFGIVVEGPPPPVPGPFSGSFRPSVHQGRGKETVRCDPALPPGWAMLEIESYHAVSTTIESCDAHGRAEDFLLMAYEDDVRARTVALVPPDRQLTLRVGADTPWTLRVLPLSHARRFDSHIEGVAHDLVVYDGPPAVLDFLHHGESNFTVHRHTPPREPAYDAEDQDMLVNEIGEVRVSAPVPGPGLLRISGDGAWKCTVRR